MTPKLITFDCAQTLVRVQWDPRAFALQCAAAVGLELDEGLAGDVYQRLLMTRWRDYQVINCTRDPAQCEAWWHELTADWLKAIGAPPEFLQPILKTADEAMYRKDSEIFQLYPDTMPALSFLKANGYKLAVISNWDYTLHRVLKLHEAYDIFDLVVASLEEGIEKPEPEIFQIALRRVGVAPAEALHVGDDPLDDVYGARRAGMKALLLDRSAVAPSAGVITSLHEIEEAAEWIT